jgi:hypothetical protein
MKTYRELLQELSNFSDEMLDKDIVIMDDQDYGFSRATFEFRKFIPNIDCDEPGASLMNHNNFYLRIYSND